ncbi:MAG TPA: ASCH domain-containing protein, partial [Chloroflexi bacterium]|nr:ASCH domain-containing protein [Chloroflexota bacterium]
MQVSAPCDSLQTIAGASQSHRAAGVDGARRHRCKPQVDCQGAEGGDRVAGGEVGSLALLPIHPRFAELIINGHKKVEFRKTKFRQHVSHVVLYASRPVQGIIAYFEVSGIRAGSAESLWARYQSVSGIERGEFDAYYSPGGNGIAIEIGRVWVLP